MNRFKKIILWLLSAYDSSTDEVSGYSGPISTIEAQPPLPSWTKTIFWFVVAILFGVFVGKLT